MTTIPLEIPVVPNPHTQEVREHIAAIRAILEKIPGFTHPAKGARRRINFSASRSDQFLEAVAVAIEASPPLAAAAQITAEKLRAAIAFERAYRSLADDLDVQAAAVRFTIARARAEAADLGLQIYAVAKGLNRADRQMLVPHIDKMAKALRTRKPRPDETPQPVAAGRAA